MKLLTQRAFVWALAAVALSSLVAAGLAASRTPAAPPQETFQGQWLVEYRDDEGKGERTYLTLRYREERAGKNGGTHFSNWDTTRPVEPAKLQGLSREQAFSAAGTGARFQIRRDAGTFECEGWFRGGKGSGHFNFIPSAQFAAELQRRGVGSPDARQLLRLALSDAGLALLDELREQGYERPDVEGFVRLGDHGVGLEYVRGLKELGYRLGSLEALRRMRDHGVSLDFIRELRGHGFRNLTAEELVRTRDHGVSVSFIRELKGLGYPNLPAEELIRLRDHGVNATFVRRVKAQRNDTPTVEELIRLRNRGGWEE